MPKTPTKVREINNLIVKDKGTPTATTREGERRNTTISRRRRRRTEKRERKTAERGSDPIRSDPIRERERETVFRFLLSLCVIFDIIIIVWCNHHHSPSRKTRGKKGKKERKKERKKKSRDDEDDEDDEEEEYGVGGIRTIQQE